MDLLPRQRFGGAYSSQNRPNFHRGRFPQLLASEAIYFRYTEMPSTSDDDCLKVQVMISRGAQHGTYLFFYGLSLNSPINLNVAHAIGVTPSRLKLKKWLFSGEET